MVTRKLILATLVAALFGCGRSPSPAPPRAGFQTPARPADNMHAGPGYNGGDPENIHRPTGVGGGPASETMEHSDMDHSGVDPSAGSPTTSTPSTAESDMTGEPPADATPKAKKKLK